MTPAISPLLARLGLVGGGLGLVTLVVLLAVLVNELHAARERIESQDATSAQILRELGPVLRETRPLARDARRLVGPLRASGDELASASELLVTIEGAVRALGGEGIPLLRSLSGADLGGTVRRVDSLVTQTQPLVRALGSADPAVVAATLQTLSREGLPLLREVHGARLAGTARGVRALTAAALRDRGFPRLLSRSNRALLSLRRGGSLGTLPRSLRAVVAVDRVLRELLGVQRRALSAQEQTLSVQRDTRDIQQDTLGVLRESLEAQRALQADVDQIRGDVRDVRNSVNRIDENTDPGGQVPVP